MKTDGSAPCLRTVSKKNNEQRNQKLQDYPAMCQNVTQKSIGSYLVEGDMGRGEEIDRSHENG